MTNKSHRLQGFTFPLYHLENPKLPPANFSPWFSQAANWIADLHDLEPLRKWERRMLNRNQYSSSIKKCILKLSDPDPSNTPTRRDTPENNYGHGRTFEHRTSKLFLPIVAQVTNTVVEHDRFSAVSSEHVPHTHTVSHCIKVRNLRPRATI